MARCWCPPPGDRTHPVIAEVTFDDQVALVAGVMDDPTIPRRQRLKLEEMVRRGLPEDADFKSLHIAWLNKRFAQLYKGRQG